MTLTHPSGRLLAPRQSALRLLDRSWEARYRDVRECHRLALMAASMSDRTTDTDLQALAYGHLGNACRLVGNYSGAADALHYAQSRLREDREAAALIWEFWGSLLESVRQYESAIRVLRRAEGIRISRGGEGLGKVKTQLGIVLGYAGDPVGAVRTLREAIRLTSSANSLRFAVQPLVRFLVESGAPSEAQDVLCRCERLLAGGPPLFRLKTDWHRALVHQALGAPAAAAVILGSVRSAFAEAGMPLEAALSSIDLSVAQTMAGDLHEARVTLIGVGDLLNTLGLRCDASAAEILTEALNGDPEAPGRLSAALLQGTAPAGIVPPA